MLKLLVAGVLALLLMPSVVAAPFSVVRQYVYPLEVHNYGRDIVSSGSGVLIADGVLLTVAHVLPTSKRLQTYVVTKAGASLASVLYVDEALDLALLSVNLRCPCAPISRSTFVDVDTEVYAVGYPLYVNYRLQVVTVGHTQGIHQNMLITTTNTAPGGSGGAIFARDRNVYQLVGLITGAAVINIGPPFVTINQIQSWFVVSSRAQTLRRFLTDANEEMKKEAKPPFKLNDL